MTSIPRSELLYVTRRTKQALQTLAQINAAVHGHDLVQLDQLADEILAAHLDAIPKLAERAQAIKEAIKEIDKRYQVDLKPL